ncbi:enoyl-CoA hydratase-related protein [Bacillus chungangensis]|uniref:Enoyl-CoA hydratase/carnithine racemase n=1 Tax=Bacillus chungangensis TaxID=587633 RepID=A0ABT9WZ10_9BACI|nr:enoyl-CoA hydratase-related protein [Bacillus chungangensis]MDQ0178353.1 enoyl-CoA hydratase/carnithine racemase [Bacillus chungangensis]
MTKNISSDEDVYLKVDREIGTIFINRPHKRNALSYRMWETLIALVDDCEQNPDVKVIILRSTTDTAFSAGSDIAEFPKIRSTKSGAIKYNDISLKLEEKIGKCLKPSISMIRGFCVGGGCEIAVACDFRFSDTSGVFGITPAKLGLVYNTPGTKNLIDLVGPSKAKDILFSGRLLPASEALAIGLIDRIIDASKLEAETYEYAEMLCKNAQLSIRGSKQIMNEIRNGAVKDSDEITELVLDSFTSADYHEGVAAFLEKRKPKFTYS